MSSSPSPPPRRLASRKRAVVVCLLAVLISGLMHGYLDGRWVDQPDLERVGSRLTELPPKCGVWELVNESELAKESQRQLRCYGSVVREYWNPATGDRVNVFVVFGPRGPIAVHTPEVCYSSATAGIASPRTAETITTADRDDQFWKMQFRANESQTPHLEVWYGWSDGGAWQAAKYPRVWMTDRLYKIQVAGSPSETGQKSPVEDFLESFLPALNKQGLRKVSE